MSAEELFAYTLGAIGAVYVVGFSVMAYLAFRFGLPMLGAPRREPVQIPPWIKRRPVPDTPTGGMK
jgi:hypothetical protein